MPNKPDVTIIIVTWNVLHFVIDCLKSIKRTIVQSTYEIIVIDNASSDATVAHLKQEFPRVKVIANSTNQGFAAANNQGIELAQGRYTLILNPDTLLLPNTVDYLVSFMDEHPSVGACTAKVIWPDGNVQRSCARKELTPWNLCCGLLGFHYLLPNHYFISGLQLPPHLYLQQQNVEVISGAFMMIRTTLLTQIGGFNEQYFFGVEDIALSKRIRDNGWEIMYIPDVEIIHIGGRSQSQNCFSAQIANHQGRIIYFRKYYPRFPIFVIQLLLFIHLLLRKLSRTIYLLFRPKIISKNCTDKISLKTLLKLIINSEEQ